MFDCRPADCILVESGFFAERSIHYELDLPVFDVIHDIRSSLAHFEHANIIDPVVRKKLRGPFGRNNVEAEAR